MCTSVPQMAVLWTLISTSLPPTTGIGTSSSHSPSSACFFTNAFMTEAIQFVLITGLFMRNRGVWMPLARDFSICASARRDASRHRTVLKVLQQATDPTRPAFARFRAQTLSGLLWLDHEIRNGRIANVQALMPCDALIEKIAPGLECHLPSAAFTGNPHRSTR